MEWNFRSICSTPTLRGRGWMRPLRSTSQIWLILYNLQFEALHPRLFPPKCPPSHPCPLCHLARHHPHLLWTHIQVGNCIFFLPIFNLSFLSVLTRSSSLRIPMSGSRCKWISNFSLGATHHQLYCHHPDRAALCHCPHPPHGHLGQEAIDGEIEICF